MKRILILLLILATPAISHAAWTYSAVPLVEGGGSIFGGDKVTMIIKITATTDGNAATPLLSDMLSSSLMRKVPGTQLFGVSVEPDATSPPDSTMDIQIQNFNSSGPTIFDDATSFLHTAHIYVGGDEEIGQYPVIGPDLYFTIADDFTDGDIFYLYLYLMR